MHKSISSSHRLPALFAAVAAASLAVACGGGGGDAAPTPAPAPASVTGTFRDSTVENLDYVAGTAAKAATTAAGQYTCLTGDTVAFSLGGIALGSTACGASVTPLNLAGTSDVKDARVVNRLLALQLLDEDGDPSNGIRITPEVKAALAGKTLDFTLDAAAFNTALKAVLPTLNDKFGKPYSARSVDDDRRALVREHFENTLASELGAPVTEAVTQSTPVGTVSVAITRYYVQAAKSFYFPYEGTNAATKAEFPDGFLPAYGSGLAFKGKLADGTLEFYGITDRGPNGDGPNAPVPGGSGTGGAKLFPAPSFAPAIGVIALGKDGAVLKSSLPIKFSATQKATGLVLPPGSVGNSAEIPLTDAAKYEPTKADYSTFGLDTESVVVDTARNALWVSDEYGPFIVKIDPVSGIISKKYQPGTGAADLPAVLALRRANRGMEGLTLDAATGKLHGFLQSPLDDGKANYTTTAISGATGKSENVRDFARFVRWVEFDPTTEKTKLYALPITGSQYDKGRTGNAKLGDVVSLGGGKFIAIEQGARASDAKVFNHLVLIEIPANATDIAALGSDLEKSSMTGAAVNAADFAAVVPLKKTRLLDLNAAGWVAEKAEGLAVVDDSTLALTNDTDFGMKTAVLDSAGNAISGADVTACTVDANGNITGSGCATGAAGIRVTRTGDADRAQRLWLIKFTKKLSEFSVPN